MKVLYDHQCFTNQDYGGISRYFVSLMTELNKLNDVSTKLALKYSNNFYLKENTDIKVKPYFPSFNFRGKKFSSHLLNMPHSRSQIQMQNYDVLHPTYYDPYFLKSIGSKPFVLTVYDMTHELFPDIVHWFDKTVTHKKLLLSSAKRVIAISENTRQDLIKLLKVPADKIEVIHLASSIDKQLSVQSDFLKLPSRFILYVGSRNYYKNFNNTLAAFAELINNDDELFLVCAGGGKFTKKEIENFKTRNLNSKILYRQADDKSLVSLYSNANLFVFPSLYEGFGIPAIEAMNCDCPLALSNISSLPEVGGNAAVYFDPYNPSDISKQMASIIYNENFRAELIDKGRLQRNKFSWKKTAYQTKKVYESIL